LVDMNRLS